MRKIILFILSFLYSHSPYAIDFYSNTSETLRETSDGLSSNGVYDLEILNDSTISIGTNSGLNIAYYND